MRTVFARYGDTFATVDSGADFDIDDVFELVGIVDRINGEEPQGQRGPPTSAASRAPADPAARGGTERRDRGA